MQQNWEKVITAKSWWFELNLKEVFKYKDLIFIATDSGVLKIDKKNNTMKNNGGGGSERWANGGGRYREREDGFKIH